MSKTVSLLSALLCTFIWGTTFIAQDTGMDDIGPFTFNAVRFFVGFLAIVPLAFLFEVKKFKSEFKLDLKTFVVLSFLIGLSLFLGSALQQVALLYTDVANAAFFTIFYVPMVPIIIFIFKKIITLECLAFCYFMFSWWLSSYKFSRCNSKTWGFSRNIRSFVLEYTYNFYWNNSH